ncbi:MAG: helix-turn-helix domain-containing protein [Christensenellales bacterium]
MMLALCREEDGLSAQEALRVWRSLTRAGVDRQSVVIGQMIQGRAHRWKPARVYAARAAKLCGKAELAAHELGLYAYLFPMSENPFVCDRCRRVLSAIREYDAQNHTNLEQTALVYVKENMEIAAAAKVLFQHPNTVRYRLSKIQRIIGMEDDPLFAPMLSLTVSLSRILAEGQV